MAKTPEQRKRQTGCMIAVFLAIAACGVTGALVFDRAAYASLP